jgi:hypothetical protein
MVTLIQTVVSDEFVIQVADRRLTRPSGSVFDDEHTKLICWNRTFTAGFSGLAFIDRRQQKATCEWIAETLTDSPAFVYGVHLLRTEVETAIRKLPNNWDKRLAIVVAGFESDGKPQCAVASNFDTATGVSKDQNTFRLQIMAPAAGRKTAAHTAGALLRPMQRSVLDRYVPRIVGQPDDGINRAIRVIVENQRLVAKDESAVGLDALCVFIPRTQQAPGLMMSNLGGPDVSTANCSFGFFDADGFQYKQFGPLLAHNGYVFDRLEGTADPLNPDNQTVGIRYLKVPGGEVH